MEHITPPRTRTPTPEEGGAPTTPRGAASTDIPLEFRSQRVRHKEYKRRGPPLGSRFDEADIGDTRASLSSRFFEASDDPTSASPPPPPPPPPPAAGATRASFPERRIKVKEGVPKKATEASPERGGRAAESATTGAGTTREEGGTGGLAVEAGETTSEGAAAAAAAAAAAGADPSAGTADAGEAANVAAVAAPAGCGTAADDTAAPACAGKRKVGAESGEERREGESPHKAAAPGGGGGSGGGGSGGASSREGRKSVAEDCSGTVKTAVAVLKPEVSADGKDEGGGTREGDCIADGGGGNGGANGSRERKDPQQG
ncbi:unnamed protein product [Ectocarpus fasciculatus]